MQQKAIVAGKGTVLPIMWRGALTQIVTGVLLVATIEIGDLSDLNNVKIAVKLAIAVVITVLVFVYRRKDPAPSWVLWLIGGLTLANVVIAVAWR